MKLRENPGILKPWRIHPIIFRSSTQTRKHALMLWLKKSRVKGRRLEDGVGLKGNELGESNHAWFAPILLTVCLLEG